MLGTPGLLCVNDQRVFQHAECRMWFCSAFQLRHAVLCCTVLYHVALLRHGKRRVEEENVDNRPRDDKDFEV